MSRSGYTEDDVHDPGFARWHGAVNRALRGRRGQAFLREMLAALDALPKKELVAEYLVREDGGVCAIGSVCKARGMDISYLDASDPENVANAVGIAPAMAAEIAYQNDEGAYGSETPAARFARVRAWVERKIMSKAKQ